MLRKISFFEANNFILTTSSNCCIRLSLNNVIHSWLLDTGATISALKYKHALEHNLPIHNEKIIINGIGGKVHAIGYTYLKLRSDDKLFRHKFYVFDSLPCKASGIIGQDFLNTYSAIIDLKNDYLTLVVGNNIKCNLRIQRNDKYIWNVAPRCESIHYIKTNYTEECVVICKELCEGIYLASSIVKPLNGLIPIRILNTTENTLTLENIEPEVHKLSDYSICTFDKPNSNANRVKQLFSLLKLGHLNEEEQISIENLCAKYSDIFYLQGDKLSTTDIYEHTITLKQNVSPVFTKPYRLPHSQKQEIKSQIDKLLRENIIEKCNSSWSSPLLLVPKRSDDSGEKKLRLVIDYRKLNNLIEDDKFPLPNMSEILDALAGSVYFTHLDLYNGFYNVKLHKDSRKYTAFDSGQYQMVRMPMGLKTSPGSFSRMMNMAMSGLTYEKCFVYMDDLIIYGFSLDNHNKNLQDVFERLRKVNLKLNPQKCDFLKKQILYLGHVVSDKGILPDPSKIEVVRNYPQPKTTDEVKRFTAFVNYYRKFVPNFAEKASPLNRLCKKNIRFNWDDQCQKAFETLKESITSPPVLAYPDFSPNNQFIIQTDASNHAIGAVMMNKNMRPVAFASRSLNKAEKNYPTIEKELLAIVWAVKHFRPYLYGKEFKIQTDHRPLVYLFNMRDPSSRLMKFRLLLEEYNFSIEYVKGTGNAAADALSRIKIQDLKEMSNKIINVMTRAQKRKIAHTMPDSSANIDFTDDWSDQPKVVEAHIKPKDHIELVFIEKKKLNSIKQQNDVRFETKTFCYVPVRNSIYIKYMDSQSQITPAEFVRELDEACLKNGINELYFVMTKRNNVFVEKLLNEVKIYGSATMPRLCILKDIIRIENKDDQKVILNDFHLLPTSGHAGMRRMLSNIKKYYFWPGLEKDVINFVKRCDKCQRHKYSTYVKEPMVITSTANTAFEKIYLDIVGPLERDNTNYSYILTLQCELSKYVEAYPLISKNTTEVARILVNNFILRYGIPKEIATDRGAEFMSSTMNEVCKLLHITKTNSTAYHHQSIGALENSHKHLGSFLRIQCDNHPEMWSQWLPFWCFSFNTSVHRETKFTPYELVFGKKCSLPSNLLSNIIDPLYTFDNYPLELKFRLQLAQKEARENLLSSKIKRKEIYDRNMNPVVYKPNDLILVKNEVGNKLNCVYSGPYVVIKDMSPNVEIMRNNKPDVIHKNRTKLYHSS